MKKAIPHLSRVVFKGGSLSALPESTTPFEQAVCYGVCRWLPKLARITDELLHKPLKAKNRPILIYIYIGLFQLLESERPDHAIVNECVELIKSSPFRWASGLLNKLLKTFIDRREEILERIESDTTAHFAHPQWIIDQLTVDYGHDEATLILIANNHPAPMTLRVNAQQHSRDDFLQACLLAGIEAEPLSLPLAVQLKTPISVNKIPGFDKGSCSVQDESGQRIAQQLDLAPGQRILDACCAPGSKTGHILETEPNLAALVGLDIDAERLKRVNDNLIRLGLNLSNVALHCADAQSNGAWCDKEGFDRILLDAPCSGSGVIRRHPDIKLSRRPEDITQCVETQLGLLNTLWRILKPGGRLVYSTCSVFKAENAHVIEQFEADHPFNRIFMQQWLPKINGQDGFFIATLEKPLH